MKNISLFIVYSAIGWSICGGIMFSGMAFLSLDTTLIIHAVGAPIVFALLNLLYRKLHTSLNPLKAASIAVGVVVFLDIMVVSIIIYKNFEMFESFLGTWLVFILIFIAVWVTSRMKI